MVEKNASYLPLARRYRPRRFADVVGQSPIVETLANALRSGRVAQACLLVGPRGVGKTTLARILSMALNCPSRKSHEADPCGDCDACRRTAEGNDLDVLEIDGASHTGVDAVRTICENALAIPARSAYRIYIIDEVHMLSTPAFNALLKTLEEPPPHVKFVFATTHPHKVPATVQSRCQRFDFRRIDPSTIARELARVCAAEGIDAEAEALAAISERADGGMRDALTMLDQLRAHVLGTRLDAARAREMLGLADARALDALLVACAEGNAAGVSAAVEEAWRDGRDLETYAREVLDRLRVRLPEARSAERDCWLRLGEALFSAWPQIGSNRVGRSALEWALFRSFPPLSSGLLACAAERSDLSAVPDTAQAGAAGRRPESPLGQSPRPSAPLRDTPALRQTQGGAPVPPLRETEEPVSSEPAFPESGVRGLESGVGLDDILAKWPECLERLRARSRTTAAFLSEGKPTAARGGTIEVAFAHAFHRDAVSQPAHRSAIESVFSACYGGGIWKLKAVLRAPSGEAEGPASPSPPPSSESDAPIVRKATEIFQGRSVSPRREEGARG